MAPAAPTAGFHVLDPETIQGLDLKVPAKPFDGSCPIEIVGVDAGDGDLTQGWLFGGQGQVFIFGQKQFPGATRNSSSRRASAPSSSTTRNSPVDTSR